MFKRKLFIPSILLLASSGATAPLVQENSWSLGSLFNNSKTMSIFSPASYSLEGKEDIIVDSSASGVQVSDWNAQTSDISISKDRALEMENLFIDLVDDIKSMEATSDLYSEISKEEGALKIDSSLKQKYSEYSSGLQNHEDSFKLGQKIVSKFKSLKRFKKNSNSKLKVQKDLLPLSPEQRQAIQKFYEVFYKLAVERKLQFSTLQDILGESLDNKNVYIPSKKSDKVSKSLDKIKWSSIKVELKNKNAKGGKATLSNWYGWGTWNSSPWKALFKSEREWKSNIRLVEEAEKELRKYLKNSGVCQGNLLRKRLTGCHEHKEEYENKLKDKKENVNLVIALNLLREMKALSFNSQRRS